MQQSQPLPGHVSVNELAAEFADWILERMPGAKLKAIELVIGRTCTLLRNGNQPVEVRQPPVTEKPARPTRKPQTDRVGSPPRFPELPQVLAQVVAENPGIKCGKAWRLLQVRYGNEFMGEKNFYLRYWRPLMEGRT